MYNAKQIAAFKASSVTDKIIILITTVSLSIVVVLLLLILMVALVLTGLVLIGPILVVLIVYAIARLCNCSINEDMLLSFWSTKGQFDVDS